MTNSLGKSEDIMNTQRPKNEDREQWRRFWAETQPREWFEAWGHWRTEPEIALDRQRFLHERLLHYQADIFQGIYPFKSVQLTRADVEWLLATHDNQRGPVNWEREKRPGIDLRGADLGPFDGQAVNLSFLPLAGLRGGLGGEENILTNPEHVGDARLSATLLHAAAVDLEGAILVHAHLEGSILTYANLKGVNLKDAHLESADLYSAQFEAEIPADLTRVTFDTSTIARQISLGNSQQIGPTMRGIQWGDTYLSEIDWSSVKLLNDEVIARQGKKTRKQRTEEYQRAASAYMQLASTLRSQGITEAADRYFYRSLLCQRRIWWLQRQLGKWFFAHFLDLLAGYGYRPGRTLVIYILLILAFTWAYMLFGTINGHSFHFDEALVYSLTSFHGRGFFPGGLALDDPVTRLAAGEAVTGLVIEASFIATFTQRYFSR
jgi:uncharacterized protein YjbI with pentapeptide repeats